MVKTHAQHVKDALESKYPPEVRDNVVLLFSAHSLPMMVVDRGDPYPQVGKKLYINCIMQVGLKQCRWVKNNTLYYALMWCFVS